MAHSSYMQQNLPAPEENPINGHVEDNGVPPRPSPSRSEAAASLCDHLMQQDHLRFRTSAGHAAPRYMSQWQGREKVHVWERYHNKETPVRVAIRSEIVAANDLTS